MPRSPGIRKLFEDVNEATVKRLVAGRAVRVLLVEDALYILTRSFEEVILVEPRIRPGGHLCLTYALRDERRLADRLARSRKDRKHECRRGKLRRLGRA